MKRPSQILGLLSAILVIFSLAGCGGSSSSSSLPSTGAAPNNTGAVTTAALTGTLIDTTTSHGLANVVVTVGTTGLTGYSNNSGYFSIASVPDGIQVLTFTINNSVVATDTITVSGTSASIGTFDINTAGTPPPPPDAQKAN
jgi:hypothetical protein